MSFSSEWENKIWSKGRDTSWPWSDVVSLFYRYSKKTNKENLKLLELGSGTGANYPFFQSLNIDYYAIEGSQSAVNKMLTKFPTIKGHQVICGDFTIKSSFDTKFDIVLDRSSLICNSLSNIKNSLINHVDSLKRNGIFIAIDWFDTSHDCSLSLEPNTNKGHGHLKDMGNISFIDHAFIIKLAKETNCKILHLEKKTRLNMINNTNLCAWDFVLEAN